MELELASLKTANDTIKRIIRKIKAIKYNYLNIKKLTIEKY